MLCRMTEGMDVITISEINSRDYSSCIGGLWRQEGESKSRIPTAARCAIQASLFRDVGASSVGTSSVVQYPRWYCPFEFRSAERFWIGNWTINEDERQQKW